MTAAANITERNTVRCIPGPFVVRLCLRSPSGFQWVERVRRGQGHYLDRRQLEFLRSLPFSAEAVPLVPVLPDRTTVVWPVLPTPELLCDPLFSSARGGTATWGVESFQRLGAFLGRLHALPVPDPGIGLPERRQHAWLARDQEAAAGVRAARTRLPLDVAPSLNCDVSLPRPADVPMTIVHGRFSTGVCVPTKSPAVMGWREAGVGDPARDLAYMLAELVEAAAVLGVAYDVAVPRIEGLLRGYRDGHGGSSSAGERWPHLRGLVADRIVEHYAQGSWAFGQGGKVADLLRAVDERWARLREVVGELR
jgi:hypothetical protein